MKLTFTLFAALLFSVITYGQIKPAAHLNSQYTAQDSVYAYYDGEYFPVEKSKASIVRHMRYNFKNRRRQGSFKDLDINDLSFVMGQGQFSDDGKRQGIFICYYPNHVLHAKVTFKDNLFDGPYELYYKNGKPQAIGSYKKEKPTDEWEFFYESGQPKLKLSITDGKTKVLDAWLADDVQTVTNSTGEMITIDQALQWTGKIADGLPNGVWLFKRDGKTFGSEVFKNGKFFSGNNNSLLTSSDYRDKSRINFFPKLPVITMLYQ